MHVVGVVLHLDVRAASVLAIDLLLAHVFLGAGAAWWRAVAIFAHWAHLINAVHEVVVEFGLRDDLLTTIFARVYLNVHIVVVALHIEFLAVPTFHVHRAIHALHVVVWARHHVPLLDIIVAPLSAIVWLDVKYGVHAIAHPGALAGRGSQRGVVVSIFWVWSQTQRVLIDAIVRIDSHSFIVQAVGTSHHSLHGLFVGVNAVLGLDLRVSKIQEERLLAIGHCRIF